MAWHAIEEPQTTLIFLLRRANAFLWDRLPKVTCRFLPQLRDRVTTIRVEDVLERLRIDLQAPLELHAHAEALCAKYRLRDSARTALR
jgi:hypothetical protein